MKIPFGKTFSITDAQLKDGIAQGLVDGFIDHDNAYKSRNGLTEFCNVSEYPIDGMYVDTYGNAIAVSDGLVYTVSTTGVKTVCTGDRLNSGVPCTFCEDDNYVFIGHGGYIAKVDVGARTVSLINTATAPQGVTHVKYIQGYVVSNGTSGIPGDTFFTGPFTIADYLTVFEVFNSEALPDGCLAVETDGQFIYSFGQRSVEIANNDGVTPWSKYSIGYIPYGIHAPYSLTKIDSTFYWLGVGDNSLRIMRITGGNVKTVSTPYDAIINKLGTTLDAYGYTCGIDGHTFYVLQFPTEQLTLVYHIQMDAWYRWAKYDTDNAVYRGFLGRCQVYHPTINKNLIGTTTGTIATLDGFSDLGGVIRFELTSGNVTGETYKQKRAGRMRFQLQRGRTTSATSVPYFNWQHRDDGGNWAPERQVSIGALGNYGYLGQLDRLGIYRERQHRLIFTDDTCQFVFIDCEEQTKLLQD